MDGAASSIAPDWQVAQWFNATSPLTLQDLRGKVVVLHAFQMLCPGCVTSSIPQAQRITRAFDPAHLAVIGIHTEFELWSVGAGIYSGDGRRGLFPERLHPLLSRGEPACPCPGQPGILLFRLCRALHQNRSGRDGSHSRGAPCRRQDRRLIARDRDRAAARQAGAGSDAQPDPSSELH